MSSPLRRNPLVWLALAIILIGTVIGLEGHFWVGIGADVAAIVLVIVAKRLTGRRKPD
jgi:hypothetical protein